MLRNVSFHKSCKCGCLLDEKVCNNKQKWNKNKCRCECLEIKKCDNNYSWNVVNCSYELRKAAALIVGEKCDAETGEKIENKTVTLIKKMKECTPFVDSSLFFCLCFSNNNWNYDLLLFEIEK